MSNLFCTSFNNTIICTVSFPSTMEDVRFFPIKWGDQLIVYIEVKLGIHNVYFTVQTNVFLNESFKTSFYLNPYTNTQ